MKIGQKATNNILRTVVKILISWCKNKYWTGNEITFHCQRVLSYLWSTLKLYTIFLEFPSYKFWQVTKFLGSLD